MITSSQPESTEVAITRIAVSGIAGSFSDAAAKELADKQRLLAERIYEVSAAGCFAAVATGRTVYAVVPLFNLLGGPVLETVAAMSAHTFRVVEVLATPIDQNLFVLPGKSKGDIRAVVSHPQALGQCRNYLAKHMAGALLQEYADTALAAEDLAARRLPTTTAIIASKEAGKLFGLELLEEKIQDDAENYTTFLLISEAAPLEARVSHG